MGDNYEIKTSENLKQGRFAVASQDIKAGDLILKDTPYVLLPSLKTLPVCLQCFKSFKPQDNNNELPKCKDCGFPLCQTKECEEQKLFNHVEEECRFLSKLGVKPAFRPDVASPIYMAIGPLRVLLKALQDPNEFNDRIKPLMGHVDALRKDEKSPMALNSSLVVRFIKKSLGLDEFSSEEITECLGILKTNCVKLHTERSSLVGMGLYPIYSLFNHSCLVNTKTKKLSDGTLELYATDDIKKGDEIYTRYVTPQLGTFRRQQLLQKNWHFACDCQRCKDPTELGTHLNSIRCLKCQGNLVPEDPRDLKSDWKCIDCEHMEDHANVTRLIMGYNISFEKCLKRMDKLEGILESKVAKMFHSNHFINLGIKERIVHLLINEEKRTENIIDQKKLYEKKIMYFESIAEVLKVVDSPGDVWVKSLKKMKTEAEKFKSL